MIQKLREKVNTATESTTRQSELIDTTVAKMRNLEDERSELESKVRKLEAELADCELSKESFRREKQTVTTLHYCVDIYHFEIRWISKLL